MAKSRLIGDYPVIGIRPTIDGRRGPLNVRGSLEEQTMNMAKAAKKLFEDNAELAQEIEDERLSIAKTYGKITEDGNFSIGSEVIEQAQNELNQLFSIEQDVNITKINITATYC